MSDEMAAAIVGGILGALAGGIVAFVLNWWQSRVTLRRDKEQRTEIQKARAFSVCVKLVTIINTTLGLHTHIQQRLGLLRKADGKGKEPWQVLIPMIGFTDEGSIRFEAEELAVFVAAHERGFVMDLIELAHQNASSLISFQDYYGRWREFTEKIAIPADFRGEILMASLTREEITKWKPYTIPLNSTATALADRSEESIQLARKVALDYGRITKAYFNDPKFIDIAFPSDEELAKMIEAPPP